jgi:hypothetical protein
MYIWRNNEARSCNHCWSGKSISITYCECVFVALNIQHAIRVRYIVICDLPGCTIFFHYFKNGTNFGEEKSYWKLSAYFDFINNFCLKHFSCSEELNEIRSKVYIGLHVEYWSFLSGFNETCIFSTYFRKMYKYQISWKYVQWEPSFFMWTNRRTDRHDEATNHFS